MEDEAMVKKKNIKGRAVMSPAMKMADLVNLNYHLLSVLSRLGVDLGFGEITVEEACRKHSLDVNAFLLICNVYSYDDYIPSGDLLSAGVPGDIVKYLHSSHIFYLEHELPELEKSLEMLVAPCDEKQKRIIDRFFSDYRKEVENHFAYEETVVFPYIEAFSDDVDGSRSYSIEQFEENHSNIDEKLCDLKNIVMKYLPETCDTVLRNNVLYHICFLEEDLDKHTLIENNVLIPMMTRLEENETRK